jgi:hypothetical protein
VPNPSSRNSESILVLWLTKSEKTEARIKLNKFLFILIANALGAGIRVFYHRINSWLKK